MNNRNSVLRVLLCLLIAGLLAPGCKKTSTPTATPITYGYDTTDTAQNIFTVSTLNSPVPGEIFISPFVNGVTDTGLVMVLDQNGHVKKQKRLGGMVLNFQKCVSPSGQVRYLYQVYDKNSYIIPGLGYGPGYEVIADSNFNEIKRVRLMDHGTITTATQTDLDGHDFIYIDDNHYILESYYQKTVNNIPSSLRPAVTGVPVVACVIQEVQNGSVIWQWDATDHTEFYTASLEENAFSDSITVHDYAHLNSMFVDPRDNNLICSFRNLDEIVKIDRTSGAIVWYFGGKNDQFHINATQTFLRQHHATLTDDNQTLLLFDDGIAVTRQKSRILEFKLDETNKVISSYTAFPLSESYTQYMGSVQKNSATNTYFIGGGTAGYALEINYVTGQKSFEFTSKDAIYRAYKY